MAFPESESEAADTSAPKRDKRLQSPHDRLINQTLQQVDAARVLLAKHLPADVVQHLKLNTLTRVDTSFIDRNLRLRLADRLFSVEVSDEIVSALGMQQNFVYVYVLIDHKSTDEPRTLMQMLGYIVRIWENALDNGQPLVPIIPWVIYNGSTPWRAASSLDQLLPVPEAWKRYVPGLELAILDVSRMDDATMGGHPILQVALTLLKYGREPQLDVALRPLLQMLAQTIGMEQAKNVLDSIRTYVMSVNPIVGEEKLDEMVTEFWPVQPEPGSIADQLLKKGEARGEARGKALEKLNTIRTLQSILGQPQSSDEELSDKGLEDLHAVIESLQQQIAGRLK